MTNKIKFLIIITFLSSNAWSQGDTSHVELKKNALYGTAGSVVAVLFADFSYERMIIAKNNRFCNSLWLKAGAGLYSSWGYGGPCFSLRGTYLSGLRNSHFEASLGILAIYDKVGHPINVSNARYFGEPVPTKLDDTWFVPSGSIGYRHQKPNGHFIFRTGAGFPETAYLSLGFCF